MPLFQLDVTAKGFTEVAAGAAKAAAEVQNGSLGAMRRGLDIVKASLEAHVPIGPAHFGGHLRDSFRVDVKQSGTLLTGHVFATLPEGRWLQGGTKAHAVAPVRKRALRINGRYVAAVHHPGQRGRDIKGMAAHEAYPAVSEEFRTLIKTALLELQLK